MKHKTIIFLLVILTILLAYFVQQVGTYDPENPTVGDRIFVTISIAVLFSSITVIPYYIFIRRQL